MKVKSDFFRKANTRVDSRSTQIDYQICIDRIQQYIANNSTELYDKATGNLSAIERKSTLMRYIDEYLNKYKPVVYEFIVDGNMDYERLKSKIVDEIINYDILTDAMNDPQITEIRINNGIVPGGIWVEKNGLSEPLSDKNTHMPIYFKDIGAINKFINNLLKFSKTTMSVTEALVHGTTIEGFRIAATDAYASARPKGGIEKSPTCVIRKFSSNKMKLENLVEKKSMCNEMAALLALFPKVDATAVFVGATGTGKTVGLQATLLNAPLNKRIVLIQNPAEIDVSFKDEKGNELRDYISWEAKDIRGSLGVKSSAPTNANLMHHSLRNSPQIFVFGELRNEEEFAISMEAAASGHYFYSTFHADDEMGAINRYTTAVMASSNSSSEDLVKTTICENVKFIVVFKRLADGSRKVTSISEICGVSRADGAVVPVINTIFRFIPEGNGERTEDGMIKGQHYQVGTISSNMHNRFILAGATKEELDFIATKASEEKPIIGTY